MARLRAAAGVSLVALVALSRAGVAGQLPLGRAEPKGVADLAEACGVTAPEAVCWELALAALAVQRGVGMASTLGSDIPGTASTVGLRLGSRPRLSLSVGAAGAWVGRPFVGADAGALGRSMTATGFRGAAAVGVSEGMRFGPGIGGFLSLDATLHLSRIWLPRGAGFESPSTGVGIGGRIGILSESFTTPGISVSVVHRWQGTMTVADSAGGSGNEIEAGVEVTSIRGVVGKNWFVVGLMAGVGWDSYGGNAAVRIAGSQGAEADPSGRVASARALYFAGGWLNFLVSQLSAEFGVADGALDPLDGVADRHRGYDPTRRDFFLLVSMRVTP